MVSNSGTEGGSSSNRKNRGPTSMTKFKDQHKDGNKEQRYFDVPQNDRTIKLKKKEMRAASTMWRNFKSELANRYIFGSNEGHDPREKYSYISPDQWRSFVEHRTTPEALQTREKNIARAKSNKFQRTLSRGGYSKAKAYIVAAKKAAMQAQGLTSSGGEPVIHVERHEVWLKGHIRKNKEYVNESMREVAEKITKLEEEVREGLFTSQGRQDILTEATGKDEYPGRTRGVGSFVVTSHALTIQNLDGGTNPDPFGDIPEVGKKYLIHMDDGSDRGFVIVALGKVMEGRIVQYQELDDDMVKVFVDEALEGWRELQKKFGDMTKVSDAVGGFVG
ncbi:hypothetical protein QQ045_002833 [Rhodiola kirilowii]